jgi:plasmid stabilization system protein ParE
MQVIWANAALDDIEATHTYIARFNPFAARRVVEAIVIAGDSLATFPHRGRRGIEPGQRELTVIHPYVLVYRVGNDAVEIIRVWHGSRNRSGAT